MNESIKKKRWSTGFKDEVGDDDDDGLPYFSLKLHNLFPILDSKSVSKMELMIQVHDIEISKAK